MDKHLVHKRTGVVNKCRHITLHIQQKLAASNPRRLRRQDELTFPIPAFIPCIAVAPMLCAGLATYAPQSRGSVGPERKFAILVIGGLGDFGVLWAKALGAEVWALSHSPNEGSGAKKLGAPTTSCPRQRASHGKSWRLHLTASSTRPI